MAEIIENVKSKENILREQAGWTAAQKLKSIKVHIKDNEIPNFAAFSVSSVQPDMKVENCQNLSYDTLSVIVKFGGQNWPNIKWALQGFSGLFSVFYGMFMA